MRYIFVVLGILLFLAACAAGTPTEIKRDICYTAIESPVWWKTSPTCTCEYNLKIDTSKRFHAVKICRDRASLRFPVLEEDSGSWQSLEDGKILLIVDKPVFSTPVGVAYDSATGGILSNPFHGVYDEATAKGIRKLDPLRHILDVSMDSVSFRTNVWLHAHPCGNVIRLRRK